MHTKQQLHYPSGVLRTPGCSPVGWMMGTLELLTQGSRSWASRCTAFGFCPQENAETQAVPLCSPQQDAHGHAERAGIARPSLKQAAHGHPGGRALESAHWNKMLRSMLTPRQCCIVHQTKMFMGVLKDRRCMILTQTSCSQAFSPGARRNPGWSTHMSPQEHAETQAVQVLLTGLRCSRAC